MSVRLPVRLGGRDRPLPSLLPSVPDHPQRVQRRDVLRAENAACSIGSPRADPCSEAEASVGYELLRDAQMSVLLPVCLGCGYPRLPVLFQRIPDHAECVELLDTVAGQRAPDSLFSLEADPCSETEAVLGDESEWDAQVTVLLPVGLGGGDPLLPSLALRIPLHVQGVQLGDAFPAEPAASSIGSPRRDPDAETEAVFADELGIH